VVGARLRTILLAGGGVTDLRQLPTLDELATHPELATELRADAVLLLHARAVRALVALEGPLLVGGHTKSSPVANGNGQGEQLLGAEQVGQMLGRGKSWVEHHLDSLPRRRSLLGEPMWLKSDVARWIEGRPEYAKIPPKY
jgi:hypothetical protein